MLRQRSGHRIESFADYAAAVRINPADPLVYLYLATALVELRLYDRALAEFEATGLKLGFTSACFRRAEIWQARDENDRAMADPTKPYASAPISPRLPGAGEALVGTKELRYGNRRPEPAALQAAARLARMACIEGSRRSSPSKSAMVLSFSFFSSQAWIDWFIWGRPVAEIHTDCAGA